MILAVGVLAACTTVGMDVSSQIARHDYGDTVPLRVCVLREPRITDAVVRRLIGGLNSEFRHFGIEVRVPWVEDWERPGFTMRSILPDVATRELEPPCDRLLALVYPHGGDITWSMFLPSISGAVDDDTGTHGYIQVWLEDFGTPAEKPSRQTLSLAAHELYHMLGCGHALLKGGCYERIAAIKARYPPSGEFFPGIDEEGQFLDSREEVRDILRRVLARP